MSRLNRATDGKVSEADGGRTPYGPDNEFRSLTQILVSSLRGSIFAGTYQPGARLNIADLAQHFNVSPVPLREALRNLETEGLVEFRLNRGVIVRELSGAEVRELYLMRVPVETLVAIEAARNATAEQLDGLERILHEMDSAFGTDPWHVLHDKFHREFYSISGLLRAVQFAEVLRGQMRPYSRTYLENRGHLAAAQSEHYALIEAARDKKTEKVKVLIHQHLRRPAEIAMKHLGETGDLDVLASL